MKTTEKSLIAQALKLPAPKRLRLAEKLIASLNDEEIEGAALIAGAKLAEARLDACRRGEMDLHDEDEILRLLDGKEQA